ncbi:MAG: hypothetical protein QOI09_1457 [Chloroflexota bacterium]|nr:hypothetical protein [Chloroflexota bacterium]
MDDLRQRFATLDRVPVPDVWNDVERRLELLGAGAPTTRPVAVIDRRREIEDGLSRRPLWAGRPAWVVVAAGLVAALLAAGAFAVGSGLVRPPAVVAPPDASMITPRPSPSMPPPRSPRATGSWTVTGTMQGIRDGSETTALLASGLVLLAGGHDGGDARDPASRGAELYDPSTGRWSETGNMLSPRRSGHTLTRLSDGRILVAGGSAYQTKGAAPYAQASAELYDPASGQWTSTGSMTVPRSGHVATLLADGKVLVVGGYLPNLAITRRAEIYDPITATWSSAGSTTAVRRAGGAALLPDGRVLVVGTGDRTGTVAAELYDPPTRTWTPLATPGGLHCSRMVRLTDGRILVLCGSVYDPDALSAQLFDPARGSWTDTAPPIRRFAAVVLLADGRVLVSDVGAGELYDPATGKWTGAGMPTYSGSGPSLFRITGDSSGEWYEIDTATLVPDGRVLMTIGPAALLYDPSGTP